MLRTPMNLNYQKRTIRPLYANTQATPKACFLDPNFLATPTMDIYPGMALKRLTGNVVGPVDTTGGVYGLSDFFEAPTLGIRQISDSGINACAVWVLDPDAEFQVLAPAFDTGATWADPGDGVVIPIYAAGSGAKRGMLTNVKPGAGAGPQVPVAKLVSVNNISLVPGPGTVLGSITIAGLSGSDHTAWS